MRDLKFEQRWLVVDVATDADLDQWDGVHQVCDPVRAGTYMRIGDTRYRWEFRLLPGETAEDYDSLAALKPLIAPWTSRAADDELELIRVTSTRFGRRWPTAGGATTSSYSVTPPTSPRRSSARAWARGCVMR